MKTISLITIAIIISGCASTPFENWSKADTARQVACSVAYGIDWLQTRKIARDDGYYERNIYLGEHPSTKEVDIYMGSTIVLQVVASGLLDEKYRPWYQMFWIGAEAGTCYHNYQIGLGFGF